MSVLSRNRNAAIAGGVVALHLAALWALQTGLIRRTVELIVPATIITEIIQPEPPAPPAPPPPPPRPQPEPPKARVAPTPRPLPPAPQPVAIPDPTPAPNVPTGVLTPQPPAPPIAAPVAPAPSAAPAPPAPPRVELPSSDADYLQNPKLPYPPMSRRMGEQGKVIVRVLIGADGTARKAEIAESSGFERLDRFALNEALRRRYVPGKRNGVPEEMWYRAPFNYVLGE